jgi:putative endonuclease
LGKSGEEAAAGFLKSRGYRILTKNYRSRLGEIDIIARDKDVLCFIEVKTRKSERFGSPGEAISMRKQGQMAKAALMFLKENDLLDKKARFDVVSIIYREDSPKLDLIKNAFDLAERFTY